MFYSFLLFGSGLLWPASVSELSLSYEELDIKPPADTVQVSSTAAGDTLLVNGAAVAGRVPFKLKVDGSWHLDRSLTFWERDVSVLDESVPNNYQGICVSYQGKIFIVLPNNLQDYYSVNGFLTTGELVAITTDYAVYDGGETIEVYKWSPNGAKQVRHYAGMERPRIIANRLFGCNSDEQWFELGSELTPVGKGVDIESTTNDEIALIAWEFRQPKEKQVYAKLNGRYVLSYSYSIMYGYMEEYAVYSGMRIETPVTCFFPSHLTLWDMVIEGQSAPLSVMDGFKEVPADAYPVNARDNKIYVGRDERRDHHWNEPVGIVRVHRKPPTLAPAPASAGR